MRERIEVVYENGVLRPVDVLRGQFQEHQHLTITIEGPVTAQSWLAGADPTVPLEAVRQALGKTTTTLADLVRAERDEG